jgi:hypothetical protein
MTLQPPPTPQRSHRWVATVDKSGVTLRAEGNPPAPIRLSARDLADLLTCVRLEKLAVGEESLDDSYDDTVYPDCAPADGPISFPTEGRAG